MSRTLSQLDPSQIVRHTFDEESESQRVSIVGGNVVLNADVKIPESKTIEIPKIVTETRVERVEVPVIIKEIQVLEVPTIVTETRIERVEVPVIVKEIEIVTLPERIINKEVPVEVKVIEYQIPNYIKGILAIESLLLIAITILKLTTIL
jgi:hypothetical protein